MTETTSRSTESLEFRVKVLGRMLEHLGVQMYKRREAAIAELIANCWDAGAHNVYVQVPDAEAYDKDTSVITIRDDGSGMDAQGIEHDYLVIGRNRRKDTGGSVGVREDMGRKGIGKLAGFGIAQQMTVLTWRDGRSTEFTLNVGELKKDDGVADDVKITGRKGEVPDEYGAPHGTLITLRLLKQKGPPDLEKLRESLARRFTRHIRGSMAIHVNDVPLDEPHLDLEFMNPTEGGLRTEVLSDGHTIKYRYGFSKPVLKSTEMRGFTIYVRGKTAQAPPFFFNVEGTASGQHATRYVTGEIEADYLDAGIDDVEGDEDLISTDRQEIDWESERAKPLYAWGEAKSREVLVECTNFRGQRVQKEVLNDQEFKPRIERLDKASQRQIRDYLAILGHVDSDRTRNLADALIRAYEFQHFVDVINDIYAASTDPTRLVELLSHLSEWRVLESRAVLEVVKGRLEIIEKFEQLVLNDAPEVADKAGDDNLHDIIAWYPWLLNPEWQTFEEERAVSTQLRKWGDADKVSKGDSDLRFDFLALTAEGKLIVLDIKRSDYVVTLDEMQRLEQYKARLAKSRWESISMVMVCGIAPADEATRESWMIRRDADILLWSEVVRRVRGHYQHWKAVLEGEVNAPEFTRKRNEVAITRGVIERGSVYRGDLRKEGLGPQDADFGDGMPPPRVAELDRMASHGPVPTAAPIVEPQEPEPASKPDSPPLASDNTSASE